MLQTSPEFSGVVGVLNIEYPEISRLTSAQRRRRNAQMLNKFIITYGHTYTSNLLSGGAKPKDVQELLGHSDVSTTMNIYAHSTREAKRTSARLLDKVVGGE